MPACWKHRKCNIWYGYACTVLYTFANLTLCKGETPNWENLFAVNHRTGEYLPVDGFDFAKLRQSIRTHQLHLLLQEKNKNEEKIFHNTLNADIIKKAAGLVESPQK
mmetsp:Transcript_27075/g.69681  ORF Transcript_27075/g.69681 Transcript_27075/m.69681 type:complete len:107 (-) Transcript_27075:391-711(-)